MKNNKYVIYSMVIIMLICGISISKNLTTASHQDYIKNVMINHTYVELLDISYLLCSILDERDSQSTDYDVQQKSLAFLEHEFIVLHSTLNYYSISFGANYHGDLIDFDHIASTLTTGTGTVNSISYRGILVDNTISENEYQYLTILKNDIDVMIESMTSSENPLQEIQELDVRKMDNILNLFFDTWTWSVEDSPFHLLCS